MKKLMITAALSALMGLPVLLFAQDATGKIDKERGEKKAKAEKKETQEIIIRNKADKELNLKVEINGEKVTINGKPLSEFNEDGVTINKRKIIVRDGHRMDFDINGDAMAFNMDENFMKQWGKDVIKPFLGVTTEKTDEGAKVTDVIKGSAAEKAGLKVDDVITKVGNKIVTDEEGLSDLVAAKKPKDEVKITYKRNGKENSAKVTLGERKVSGPTTMAFGPRGKARTFAFPNPGSPELEGLLAPGTAYNFGPFASFSRQKKLGLKIQDTEEGGNIKVIDVEEGSAAEKAGLKKDDIITEINAKKITNTDEAREQLNPEEGKSSYSVKVLRNGTAMSFDIKIPKKLKTADL